MSASLVGSEMCIRDSLSLRFRRDRGRGPPSARTARERGSGGGPRLINTCLLYTSDAADDM
eukprot:5310655-Alexandrium_andersonii.AAC.1